MPCSILGPVKRDNTWDAVDGVTSSLLLFVSVMFYYLDWVLDILVAWGYYEDGHLVWCILCLSIAGMNMRLGRALKFSCGRRRG